MHAFPRLCRSWDRSSTWMPVLSALPALCPATIALLYPSHPSHTAQRNNTASQQREPQFKRSGSSRINSGPSSGSQQSTPHRGLQRSMSYSNTSGSSGNLRGLQRQPSSNSNSRELQKMPSGGKGGKGPRALRPTFYGSGTCFTSVSVSEDGRCVCEFIVLLVCLFCCLCGGANNQ